MNVILSALEEKRTKLRKEFSALGKSFENDPASRIIEAHKEFRQFLEDFKGKDRMLKEAMRRIDEINDKNEQAKKELETFDARKISDDMVGLRLQLEELNREIAGIEYRAKNK